MPRVLVIDDQPDVRTMISIVLRVNHFEVIEAVSGTEGLRIFCDSVFDLVIVDIFLQDTNGFDIIQAMRERVPGVPIIAISGITALDFIRQTPEFSDVRCLEKPFRPNDLVRAIEAVCGPALRPVAADLAGGAAV